VAKVEFTHENGQVTVFNKLDNGSWKAEGFQVFSPMKMLDQLAMWVDLTYREEEGI
jgi:hypothetical protein